MFFNIVISKPKVIDIILYVIFNFFNLLLIIFTFYFQFGFDGIGVSCLRWIVSNISSIYPSVANLLCNDSE